MPEATYGSAATVLKDTLYNLGGKSSVYSVMWLNLVGAPLVWKKAQTAGVSFKKSMWRAATVVKGHIVYFGASTGNKTYVLK